MQRHCIGTYANIIYKILNVPVQISFNRTRIAENLLPAFKFLPDNIQGSTSFEPFDLLLIVSMVHQKIMRSAIFVIKDYD